MKKTDNVKEQLRAFQLKAIDVIDDVRLALFDHNKALWDRWFFRGLAGLSVFLVVMNEPLLWWISTWVFITCGALFALANFKDAILGSWRQRRHNTTRNARTNPIRVRPYDGFATTHPDHEA